MKFTTTLLAIGAILSPLTLSALPRSAEEAKDIGVEFFRAMTPDAVLSPATEALTRNENPDYYIFNVNEDDGYVIISSDDRFQEVLGYSTHGSYDSLKDNPGFQFWLSSMSAEMASTSTTAGMNAPGYRAAAPDIAPLLKCKWGQNAPYNNECWEDGSLRPTIGWKPQHAPTGCVATAMAQVMHYHQWPQAYQSGNTTFEFKWDIMESTYNGDESEEAIDQVAKLMKYCGSSVGMKYSVGSSGASSFAIPGALVNSFSYDGSTIRKIWRDSFSYDLLHELLYTELKEGRPIIVGGDYPTTDIGHQFVIDGCNSGEFFHVNWGWDGYCDGYYRITSMRPADFGTGGSEQGYSFTMDFTIGIQPKRNTDPDVMHPVLTPMGDLTVAGHPSDEESIILSYSSYNRKISVTTVNGQFSGFMNTGTRTFYPYTEGPVTRLENITTGEVTYYENIYGGKPFSIKPGYYTNDVELLYPELKDKTSYKVSLCYQINENDNPELHELQFGPGRRSYLILERNGSQLKVTQPRVENSDILAEFPAGMDRIVRRDPQTISVKVTNNSKTEYLGGVKWKFKDANGNFHDDMSDYIMVNVRPGESVSEDFMLYNVTAGEPGKYTVALYDYRDKPISDEKEVELYDFKLFVDSSNFPDEAFRQYVSNTFDTDRDGSLSDSELQEIREISLDGNQATDFTGIEHFYNLSTVIIRNGTLTDLNLSSCPDLYQLSVLSTPLETLSLAGNTGLRILQLSGTKVTDIDLSNCPAILQILVADNQIENLILPDTSDLIQIHCNKNKIKSLPLSGHKKLKYLHCAINNIDNLEIAELTNLEWVYCYGNNLTSLDISKLDKLSILWAYDNAISDFRMSSHPGLAEVYMENNKVGGELDMSGCPALKIFSFSNNELTGLTLGTHPELSSLDISGNSISGNFDVAAFNKLIYLTINGNNLTGLTLGNHPELQALRLFDNQFEGSLDISGCPKLIHLWGDNNQFNKIVTGSHPEMKYLHLTNNRIEGILDISGAENLYELKASDNKISQFKYGYHPELWKVILSNNALTHFNGDDFPSLNGNFACYGQEVHMSVSTPNFNTKSLSATGFDHNRSSDWWASWTENGQERWAECSVLSGVVIIPDEAGRDLDLIYTYLTDVATNKKNNFTIHLTREGFNSIEGVTGDKEFVIDDNRIVFGESVSGEIYTPSGILVHKGSGESDNLPSGIYIVRIGSKAASVLIP